MFLLQSIDLIGLLGLFVQALCAWGFVAIAAAFVRRSQVSPAFGDFLRAFFVLALGLTALSVRFARAHDVRDVDGSWMDGAWLPTTLYSIYLGAKALFGLYLVRGSLRLAGKAVPAWLHSIGWSIVVGCAGAAWLVRDVKPQFFVQAPVMVASACLAWRALAGAVGTSFGLQVVRAALLALAASWVLHATAVLLHPRVEWASYALAYNSFLDTAVQLALGIGLMLGALEESQRRLQAVEDERERLRRALEHDERLRALGTLVSGVAHELNNPLTVILGRADLAARGELDRGSAAVIAEQAERCRGIVRSLSALGPKSARANREDLDVAELVERVVRGLSPGAQNGGAQVQSRSLAGLRVHADRVGLEQVLSNLIINALHASPSGAVVEIAGSQTERDLVLTVTDAGRGVPRELAARVFEPFFTTKPPGEGTGLGLPIVHAIVTAHGGSIELAPGPGGRGTCARVALPHGGARSDSASAANTPTRRVDGWRLLVVDDEPEVRAVVRAQAEHRGWRVHEAESAESALALGPELAEFHAWLCDLRMPGLGGIALHDRLAAERPELLARSVFFTGDLASHESVRFADRCRRPLVQKPFDFDELFALLAASRTDGAR